MLNKLKSLERCDQSQENNQCPDCGSRLVPHIEREEYEYKGKTWEFDTHMLSCGNCGKGIVNSKERDKQKKRIERMSAGFLTDVEIKRIRQKLALTQGAMAEKLGVGQKTFARYENLSVRPSKSMDQLLRILEELPEALEILSRGPQNRIKDTSSSNNDLSHIEQPQYDNAKYYQSLDRSIDD